MDDTLTFQPTYQWRGTESIFFGCGPNYTGLIPYELLTLTPASI